MFGIKNLNGTVTVSLKSFVPPRLAGRGNVRTLRKQSQVSEWIICILVFNVLFRFFFFFLPFLLRAEKYLDHMGARNLPPHSREIFSLSKSEVENSTSLFRFDI